MSSIVISSSVLFLLISMCLATYLRLCTVFTQLPSFIALHCLSLPSATIISSKHNALLDISNKSFLIHQLLYILVCIRIRILTHPNWGTRLYVTVTMGVSHYFAWVTFAKCKSRSYGSFRWGPSMNSSDQYKISSIVDL